MTDYSSTPLVIEPIPDMVVLPSTVASLNMGMNWGTYNVIVMPIPEMTALDPTKYKLAGTLKPVTIVEPTVPTRGQVWPRGNAHITNPPIP